MKLIFPPAHALALALSLGAVLLPPRPGAFAAAREAGVDIRIETTLPTAQPDRPALAFDGKRDTFFRSGRGADDKDRFTVIFSRPLELRGIEVLTGDGRGTNRLEAGVLEVSTDGREFLEAVRFEAGGARADLKNRSVQALRIRPTRKELPQPSSSQAPGNPGEPPQPTQSRQNPMRRNWPRLVIREILLDPAPVVREVTQALCVIADTSEVPELADWGARARQLCEAWHPRIVALLASEGFEATPAARLLFLKDMRGVANTSSETDVRISAGYVRSHTNDWGMIIHELTHVVQRYPGAQSGFTKPGWLVEGIADYIRLVHFEPGARRPRINPDRAKYSDSYKTTAGFLEWVEKHYDREIVKEFNAALRQGRFEDALWRKHTGKTVEDLWQEFTDELRHRE